MGLQELFHAVTEVSVRPARFIEKAFDLVGTGAVQGVEKNRLFIGLDVDHGTILLSVSNQCPVQKETRQEILAYVWQGCVAGVNGTPLPPA